MKALKITLTHGKIWTAETSSGLRAQGASLQTCLDQIVPHATPADVEIVDDGYDAIRCIFAGIRDSGGDGNIGHGVKSA